MSIYYLDTASGQNLYPSSRKVNPKQRRGLQCVRIDSNSSTSKPPNSFPARTLQKHSATQHWLENNLISCSRQTSHSKTSWHHGHGNRSVSKSSLSSSSSNASSLATVSSTDLLPQNFAPHSALPFDIPSETSTPKVFQDYRDAVHPPFQHHTSPTSDDTPDKSDKCSSYGLNCEDQYPPLQPTATSPNLSSMESLRSTMSQCSLNNEHSTLDKKSPNSSSLFQGETLQVQTSQDISDMSSSSQSSLSDSGSTIFRHNGSNSDSSSLRLIDVEDDDSSSYESCDSGSQDSLEPKNTLQDCFPYPDPLRIAGDPRFHATLNERKIHAEEARRYESRPHSAYCQRRRKGTPQVISRLLERGSDGTYRVAKSSSSIDSQKCEKKRSKSAFIRSNPASSIKELPSSTSKGVEIRNRNKPIQISLSTFSRGSTVVRVTGSSRNTKIVSGSENPGAMMKSNKPTLDKPSVEFASHKSSAPPQCCKSSMPSDAASSQDAAIISIEEEKSDLITSSEQKLVEKKNKRDLRPSSSKRDNYINFLTQHSKKLLEKINDVHMANKLFLPTERAETCKESQSKICTAKYLSAKHSTDKNSLPFTSSYLSASSTKVSSSSNERRRNSTGPITSSKKIELRSAAPNLKHSVSTGKLATSTSTNGLQSSKKCTCSIIASDELISSKVEIQRAHSEIEEGIISSRALKTVVKPSPKSAFGHTVERRPERPKSCGHKRTTKTLAGKTNPARKDRTMRK